MEAREVELRDVRHRPTEIVERVVGLPDRLIVRTRSTSFPVVADPRLSLMGSLMRCPPCPSLVDLVGAGLPLALLGERQLVPLLLGLA